VLDFGPCKSTDFLSQQIHPNKPLPSDGWKGGTGITKTHFNLIKKYIRNAYGKPLIKGIKYN
jgi:hypothetical protein